ncbi:Uncharacterised protein [Weissella viridescens]|uniref:Uncharacterized protein n=1 Tax=Weissella viridescens TaxID=1629 RepID=A0A380P526_WEIVI|nr:Uncharacterised protein [Weissella viridescens]
MNGKKITIAGLAVAGALLVGQHFGLISEDQVKQFSQSTYLPKTHPLVVKQDHLK